MLLPLLAALLSLSPDGGVADGGAPAGLVDAGPEFTAAEAGDAGPDEADDDSGDETADDSPDLGEGEAAQLAALATDGGLLYSRDLTDAELERRWVEDVESLGSISVGLAEAGRLINGVHLDEGEAWTVVVPEDSFGTRETVDALKAVAAAVHEQVPGALPLRVNHISKRNGGYLRPHQTHQSGRDTDLGFYYRDGVTAASARGPREKLMNLEANWALIRALATLADVQVILVDFHVQRALVDYAKASGEDPVWLDRLFHAGPASLLQHARRHRDHFHVRFYSARSQELGRRVQPLLAKRPEENLVIYRIHKGDTLGHLAARYGSTVKLIQEANRLKNSLLSIGRTLNIPLRGPCTKCPLPPAVRVPPRLLPPGLGLAGP